VHLDVVGMVADRSDGLAQLLRRGIELARPLAQLGLVVDVADPALRGVAARKMLDALVFSSPTLPWRDVMVAGRWRIRAGRHRGAAAIARRYAKTIEALSGSATARPS
jgi:hypothetical protein